MPDAVHCFHMYISRCANPPLTSSACWRSHELSSSLPPIWRHWQRHRVLQEGGRDNRSKRHRYDSHVEVKVRSYVPVDTRVLGGKPVARRPPQTAPEGGVQIILEGVPSAGGLYRGTGAFSATNPGPVKLPVRNPWVSSGRNPRTQTNRGLLPPQIHPSTEVRASESNLPKRKRLRDAVVLPPCRFPSLLGCLSCTQQKQLRDSFVSARRTHPREARAPGSRGVAESRRREDASTTSRERGKRCLRGHSR